MIQKKCPTLWSRKIPLTYKPNTIIGEFPRANKKKAEESKNQIITRRILNVVNDVVHRFSQEKDDVLRQQ